MKKFLRLFVPLVILAALGLSLAWGYLEWYDQNVDRSGWVEEDGVRIYQDFYGDPVSGWLDLTEGRYFFGPDGRPRTGWQKIAGASYYFTPDGIMVTGWQELEGKIWYFTDSGTMIEGWLSLETGRYYLSSGVLAMGWQDIDGNSYYFDEDGRMVTGFAEIGGDTYYFSGTGIMATGTHTIDERIFSFGDDGIMRTGWEDTEDGRRYYYPDGPMARGWTTIEGQLFLFEGNGLMKTGWMEDGEYRYYFHEDGHAAIGPTKIDGQVHFFTPDGIEVILVNANNPVPSYYALELKNVTGYHNVDALCYDALVKMLADCEASGIEYVFNSAHRTVKQQTEILERRTAEHMAEFELSYEKAKNKALETVAVPGTSEHHLGLAVDLLGEEAVAWLQEHCWDYGFIVRYDGAKYEWTGIIDEPWHFRYVGTRVSLPLKDSGLSLEEYLGADPVKPGVVAP